MYKNKIIVIGLGNDFISDDGIGIYVVRYLKEKISKNSQSVKYGEIIFKELAVGGLQLLDYFIDYQKCIIVDAVLTGQNKPGTIYRFEQNEDMNEIKLKSSHQIDISQVITLARIFNADVPKKIIVYGIEVEDVTTFGNKCTQKVERAIPDVVNLIYDDLQKNNIE